MNKHSRPTDTGDRAGWIGWTLSLVFTFATGAALLDAARAEVPGDKGLAIAREADRRDTGWGDERVNLKMILRNRHGEEAVRTVRRRAMEVEGDGDKSLVIFEDPADVDGTALLTYSHKQGDDDQWLYLPALKRVKRIASSNKSGPFVGSEFAYEDLSSQELEQYTYRYLGEEACGDFQCFVVERDPVDEDSGYTRHVAWIDQAEYRVRKVDFYDRKGALLKTLTYEGYSEYLGEYWRAERMHMVNHQTGKSTTLVFSDYAFRNGYGPRDFDRNSLARAR